ncbi:hypothetical protein OHC33_003226 [Knufia fluminis]|uniref:Uncharacterized protein n=1 Tax=Knufia fluminis TaxID=191047 RepID=A0AAN8EJX8_9EURO|nr:hypothetical protein OHC33_003226 [Knufia fluminis]
MEDTDTKGADEASISQQDIPGCGTAKRLDDSAQTCNCHAPNGECPASFSESLKPPVGQQTIGDCECGKPIERPLACNQCLSDWHSLSRAAILLKELLYTFREATFDQSIGSLYVQETKLIIHEGESEEQCIPVFPHDLVRDYEPWVKNMLLTKCACVQANCYLERILVMFLRDVEFVQEIEELDFVPNQGPRQWIWHRFNGEIIYDHTYNHTVYLITLRNESSWVLDLTAAQYGYDDTLDNILVPWQAYKKQRVGEILKIHQFGRQARELRVEISLKTETGTFRPLGLDELASLGASMESAVANAFDGPDMTPENLLVNASDKEFMNQVPLFVDACANAMAEYKKQKAHSPGVIQKTWKRAQLRGRSWLGKVQCIVPDGK